MKVAIIGAGISGLGSAWLLAQKHEVHLYESENRLGGHAHTVSMREAVGFVPIDTGFLVYNELTYPNLVGFFKANKVETIESDMSLSIQVERKNLEWSGTNFNTIFGQRKNILSLQFYKMLLEILRFGREAEKNRHLARRHAHTLGELLTEGQYSIEFCREYLLPIGAAIWSTPEEKMLDFPAETFLTFFINHKLLQMNDRPVWRTVKNGSIQYVEKVARQLSHIHLGEAVKEVERINGKVVVRTNSDAQEFDKVILATHAPVTMKILKNQSGEEQKILNAFQYESNRTVLHMDRNFMPKSKRCWSAWNVFGADSPGQIGKVSLSYYINRLQSLQTTNDYFVTLNPHRPIRNILREFEYSHPQFNQEAIRAQRELPRIQGVGGIYYAGAWTRYGFHEDGILSAVNVAKLLDIAIPWKTE